jgi:hypothetical protein
MKVNGYKIEPRADLRKANLWRADLRKANLHGADLRKADLWRADLQGVYLQKADLQGVYLQGAKGIIQLGPMPTSGRFIYAVDHVDKVMVQAGCFWGTLEELQEKVIEDHNCPVYHAFIEAIKVWYKNIKR